MPISNPVLLPEAFANLGDKNTIPDLPGGSGVASWENGFPPECSLPLGSGGFPPDRKDMNGVLNAISAHTIFLQGGGAYIWDAATAAAGKYVTGSTVRDSSGGEFYAFVNSIDGNTTNPNTGASLGSVGGWDFFCVKGPSSVFGRVSWLTDFSTVANTIRLHDAYYTGYDQFGSKGQILVWQQLITNTSACTIAAGPIAVTPLPLVNSSGGALAARDLVAGTTYMCILDGTISAYKMLTRVPSQTTAGTNKRASYGNIFAGANPTGKMLGAGSTAAFTPTGSGKCLVTMSGAAYNTVTESVGIGLRYGTGAAPALGAAPAGTAWAGAYTALATAGAAGIVYSFTDILTLTPGTAYWFDLLETNATGTVNMPNGTFTIVEL